MTIMIVDDNESVHDIIRDTSSASFPTFVDCREGAEAVELYDRYQPDWVLKHMKEMDGFKATEAILARDPRAKIVIITAYDEPLFFERARRVGAVGYVLKEHLDDIGRIIQA